MNSSSFECRPRLWEEGGAPALASWDGLQIAPQPSLRKLLVAWTAPLPQDIVVAGIGLPASRRPQSGTGIHALALSRYSTLVLAEGAGELDGLAGALARRSDALASDMSSAIASARLTGRYAGEFLSRGIALDLPGFADGEYARTRLGQAPVIVHRCSDGYRLHWPNALTHYIGLWIQSVAQLERVQGEQSPSARP